MEQTLHYYGNIAETDFRINYEDSNVRLCLTSESHRFGLEK